MKLSAIGRSDSFGGLIDDVRLFKLDCDTVVANQPPISTDQSIALNEDQDGEIELSASDADGDVLSYQILDQPSNGTLSGQAPNLIYTPNSNFFGSDSFTFKANDGESDSGVSTVILNVQAVNDVAVATDLTLVTLEDTSLNVTLSATDIDEDSLAYSIVSQPLSGEITGAVSDLIYTPNQNFNGSDSFTYLANDGYIHHPRDIREGKDQ